MEYSMKIVELVPNALNRFNFELSFRLLAFPRIPMRYFCVMRMMNGPFAKEVLRFLEEFRRSLGPLILMATTSDGACQMAHNDHNQ